MLKATYFTSLAVEIPFWIGLFDDSSITYTQKSDHSKIHYSIQRRKNFHESKMWKKNDGFKTISEKRIKKKKSFIEYWEMTSLCGMDDDT